MEPTCTEPGLTAGSHCSECGAILEAQTEILAMGHDYAVTETAEPTCSEAGETVYVCSRCGETYTEEIAALGHEWDNGTMTAAPTCTETGEMTYACSRCGNSYTEPIAALGHDWTYTEEASADADGNTVIRICFVCSRCAAEAEGDVIVETASEGIEVVDVQMSWDNVITADDLEALFEEFTGGEIVDILLDVAAVDVNDVSAEDVQMIEAAIAEAFESAEVFYLDIALGMTVTQNGEQIYDAAITETVIPITITVGIPESLMEAEGAAYIVYRVHDGVIEAVVTADADAETLTFETDKFSTYAIAKGYEIEESGEDDELLGDNQQGGDEQQGGDDQQVSDDQQDSDDRQDSETGSADETAESSGTSTTSAKTADDNTPYLYLLMVLMAGAAAVTVSRRRRTVRK